MGKQGGVDIFGKDDSSFLVFTQQFYKFMACNENNRVILGDVEGD